MCALKKGRLNCRTMDFSSPTIKRGDTWVPKKWNGLTDPSALNIWTDGINIYHSEGTEHYVLNGDTWGAKTWNGLDTLPHFVANYVWTDGTSIYYSYVAHPLGSHQYVLNGDTWESKVWNISDVDSRIIWTDGTNIYCGRSFVLTGDTWERKTWNYEESSIAPMIDAQRLWSDGVNIYHSYSGQDYVLNGDTWKSKTWNNVPELLDAQNIWTDGLDVYYRYGDEQYVLNGDTWEPKTWNGSTGLNGNQVWTDGTNIYSGKYVLTTSAPPEPLDPAALLMGYRVGCALRAQRGKPVIPDEPVIPEPVLPESGVNPDTREITDTWEQIRQAIDEGVYSTRYTIGDTKDFVLSDGTAVAMQIVAFDADDKTDGTKAAISWVSRDIITVHAMNATNTNENGWVACGMRSWLQGEFYDTIPDEVKACIVSVRKTYFDNTTKTTLSCEDNVWIPSAREIFGGTTYEESGAEYTGFFINPVSRKKVYPGGEHIDDIGIRNSWRLRTARKDSTQFYTVHSSGAESFTGTTSERGVVLGFCT